MGNGKHLYWIIKSQSATIQWRNPIGLLSGG